jgi:hypothetical protein
MGSILGKSNFQNGKWESNYIYSDLKYVGKIELARNYHQD